MRGLIIAALLTGCGYGLVRPDGPAPRLGVIADLSPEGQLGLRVAARLRRHGTGHPRGEGTLEGSVQVGPDQIRGYAADGRSAFYRAEVELLLEEKQGGRPSWRNRSTTTATWVRGPDPLATTTARQLALADAAEALADAAWQRYLARESP